LPEWLYEAGIGEARAALVDGDRMIEARIELDDGAPRAGAVLPARLTDIRERKVTLESGKTALLASIPPGMTQGAALKVAITRAAIPETGRDKIAKAIAAEPDAEPMPGPDLRARIAASGIPVRELRAHEPDLLEAAGWSEALEEATTGDIAFPGGMLRLSPTPAMALFDVDGSGPLEPLAVAAAHAVARAIVRLDIGGSIGIDFPTIAGKAARQAVADAIDAGLPQPFERTALNGFGFLQIVRRREHASLPELLRADPVAAEARALLRTIERAPPAGPRRHTVSAAVHGVFDRHPEWLAELARRTGATHIFDIR